MHCSIGIFGSSPKSVIDLQSKGLEIRVTEDIKSYKKIIPALDQFADSFIATADDDTYYLASTPRCAETIRWKRRASQWVAATGRTKLPLPCKGTDPIASGSSILHGVARRLVGLTGAGGILYPPGALAHRPEDRASIQSLCPQADDIWLYWMGRRNGAST